MTHVPLSRQPDPSTIRSAASAAGWDVEALLRTAQLYGRVLRPRRPETCRLKVYVYPAPGKLDLKGGQHVGILYQKWYIFASLT